MNTQSFWASATTGTLLFALAYVVLASEASPQKPVTTQNAAAIQPSSLSERSANKKIIKLEGQDAALRWPPLDVDAATPTVAPGVPCPLDELLKAAGQHVRELTANLERFTAIERVEDILFRKDGNAGRPVGRSFKYLVIISETRLGTVVVDERRDGSYESPPNGIDETGLVDTALIFHPNNVNDFNMVCEGLGDWGGEPAWQLHFAQRSDVAARFHAFVEGGKMFTAKLKGRAWIARDSYQVKDIEYDLLEPIPQAHLLRDHAKTEYRPVEFASRKLKLWLPERVDLYLDYRGHHFYQRHELSNYLLFSVDTGQQIQPPRQPK